MTKTRFFAVFLNADHDSSAEKRLKSSCTFQRHIRGSQSMSNVKVEGEIHLQLGKASWTSKSRSRGQEHLASRDLKVDLCQNFDLAAL